MFRIQRIIMFIKTKRKIIYSNAYKNKKYDSFNKILCLVYKT